MMFSLSERVFQSLFTLFDQLIAKIRLLTSRSKRALIVYTFWNRRIFGPGSGPDLEVVSFKRARRTTPSPAPAWFAPPGTPNAHCPPSLVGAINQLFGGKPVWPLSNPQDRTDIACRHQVCQVTDILLGSLCVASSDYPGYRGAGPSITSQMPIHLLATPSRRPSEAVNTQATRRWTCARRPEARAQDPELTACAVGLWNHPDWNSLLSANRLSPRESRLLPCLPGKQILPWTSLSSVPTAPSRWRTSLPLPDRAAARHWPTRLAPSRAGTPHPDRQYSTTTWTLLCRTSAW